MNKYEVIFIVKLAEEEAMNGVIAKFESLIQNNGGSVEKIDRWGKRRLAYELKDHTEGYYVITHFAAPAAAVAELDRVMKITDEILRHMIIKKDE
ncbi:30S ribosomal protein S6 [Acetonema longum]|uniref:Small ribosomal subunit protein bS6 n=1 Tax=Acetonema longum DSM 6540 TaxID=1009370 RepID=F7NE41_9FIRM|nr:30S ribosomal protein S6 [Acetonema longum]EGO65696.1 30S ribosomal protein S6 [Acetonema longum DSM 6540]